LISPAAAQPFEYARLHRFMYDQWESLAQAGFDLVDCRFGPRLDLVQPAADDPLGQAAALASLLKVTGQDLIDAVVVVAAHRHGELHLRALDLPRIEAGLGTEHIIDRVEFEAPTGIEKDAEVLGVPIGCADQPEDQLSLQQGSMVL